MVISAIYPDVHLHHGVGLYLSCLRNEQAYVIRKYVLKPEIINPDPAVHLGPAFHHPDVGICPDRDSRHINVEILYGYRRNSVLRE